VFNNILIGADGRDGARDAVDLAQERAADLIVVGSSRHAFLGRILLGDDARESLDGAPCAVAIAPHEFAGSPGGISSGAPIVVAGVGAG